MLFSENPGYQAALSSYDYQEHEKILHIRSSGTGTGTLFKETRIVINSEL